MIVTDNGYHYLHLYRYDPAFDQYWSESVQNFQIENDADPSVIRMKAEILGFTPILVYGGYGAPGYVDRNRIIKALKESQIKSEVSSDDLI